MRSCWPSVWVKKGEARRVTRGFWFLRMASPDFSGWPCGTNISWIFQPPDFDSGSNFFFFVDTFWYILVGVRGACLKLQLATYIHLAVCHTCNFEFQSQWCHANYHPKARLRSIHWEKIAKSKISTFQNLKPSRSVGFSSLHASSLHLFNTTLFFSCASFRCKVFWRFVSWRKALIFVDVHPKNM